MTPRFKRLAPLRSRLKKMLAQGWERAVFREPQNQDEEQGQEELHEGPGHPGQPSQEDLDQLWAQMNEAALRGLVKQVIVISPAHRLEIDARHASLRQKKRDPESLKKMMGNKDRLFRPDRSQALLRELGLLNADGTMSRRHARKYKQVHHFVELCQPIIAQLAQQKGDEARVNILDLACGNSYLGFVLLEALHLESIPAQLLGVDLNERWIHASQDRAKALPHLQAEFFHGWIHEATKSEHPSALEPDLVIALHACDTATDQCIALALERETPALLCAPCCHAQVARQLGPGAALPGLEALHDHAQFRRVYGELITDALRVSWIEAHGYDVAVVEFVELEHSSKNLLLRAHKKKAADPRRIAQLRDSCVSMGIRPALLFPEAVQP